MNSTGSASNGNLLYDVSKQVACTANLTLIAEDERSNAIPAYKVVSQNSLLLTAPSGRFFFYETCYAFGFLAIIRYIGVNSFSLPPATKQSAACPRLSAVFFVPFGAIPILSSPPTAL